MLLSLVCMEDATSGELSVERDSAPFSVAAIAICAAFCACWGLYCVVASRKNRRG